jgi:site-specific recombinase XerD
LWVNPRKAEIPLAEWADAFLLLCRRLSSTTQETYRRDLTRYVLPAFGSYRLGQLPADEIENWISDEIAAGIPPSSVHRRYRTLRRMLQVVFANAAGNPIAGSSFLTAYFSKAQAATGIKCRFHDLRHTSVALPIAAGAHPKSIQARMGHSPINVTLDRYGHLVPELDEAIATSFDRSFREASERRKQVVVQFDFERT